MKKVVILFCLISSTSIFASINAKVWHSSTLSPTIKKVNFDDSNLIYGDDTIARGGITIIHAGENKCRFSKLSKVEFSKWRKDCQLSIQMLYSAERYVDFARKAQIEMPSRINITTEDAEAMCFASASLRSSDLGIVDFCQAPTDRLDDYLKYSADILFHEMTHLALKNLWYTFYILSSSQEDFSTLFAYLLSGQTDFVIPEDSIYSATVKYGEISPGNYGSLIALMSTLIDIQRLTYNELTDDSEKERFLLLYSKLIVKSFFEIKVETTEQNYLIRFISDFESLLNNNFHIDTNKLIKSIKDSVLNRGIDLETSLYDGLQASIIINNQPMVIHPKITASRSSASEFRNPIISLYDPKGLINNKPLTFFIADLNIFTLINECLQSSTIPDIKNRYFQCFVDITKQPLTINQTVIKKRMFVLDKHLDSFSIQHSGDLPPVGEFNMMWMFTFDSEKNLKFNFSTLMGQK